MPDSVFKQQDDGIEFWVYLSPGSKKEAISGVVSIEGQSYIKIMIHAKPTENQANIALVEFISKQFKIAKSNIIIKKGLKSRNKKIFISNLKLTKHHFARYFQNINQL